MSFQDRYMQRLPLEEKVAMVLPYLQRAGGWSRRLARRTRWRRNKVSLGHACRLAAGDRIKIAGDILGLRRFLPGRRRCAYDEKASKKSLRKPGAAELLAAVPGPAGGGRDVRPGRVGGLDHAFVAERGIKIGEIIHPVRVAVTGQERGLRPVRHAGHSGQDASIAASSRTGTIGATSD